MTDAEKILTELETNIDINKRNPQAVALSEQILHRAASAMSDVWSHGLAQIAQLRTQLDDLEKQIERQRTNALDHIQTFVQLVGDSEDAIHGIARSINRISDHLDGHS